MKRLLKPKKTTKSVSLTVLEPAYTASTPITGAQVGIGSVLNIIEGVDRMSRNSKTLAQLETHTRFLVEPLMNMDRHNLSPVLEDEMRKFSNHLGNILQHVKSKSSAGIVRRFLDRSEDENDLRGLAQDLKVALDAFHLSQALHQAQELHVRERSALVMSLPRAHDASYDSGREDAPLSCREGTCVAILSEAMSWLEGAEGERSPVHWLSGVAKIGKSTIAKTVAERADEKGMLGGTFFFSRSDAPLRDPRLVFPTLAFQLAQSDKELNTVIGDAIQLDATVGHKKLLAQLEGLILTPLSKLGSYQRPTLIILDALDECEERGAVTILRLLLSYAARIPFLRILITSRPEPHILSVFGEFRNYTKTILHDIEASVIQQDICPHVRSKFLPNTTSLDPPNVLVGDDGGNERMLGLYDEEVSLLLALGTALEESLETNVPDASTHVRALLRRLVDEKNMWAHLDPVDIVIKADAMFEAINSLGWGLQEREPILMREKYPQIRPPRDLPRLYSLMVMIEGNEVWRQKATRLQGRDAVTFMDRLTETQDAHPQDIHNGDVLKLLQRIVEASEELPTQLLITGVSDMIRHHSGGEADIFKCRYQNKDAAARAVRIDRNVDGEFQNEQKKVIRREIVAHRQLKHQNVLKLIGVFNDDQYPLCIITPWMENGTASSYLKTHPEDFTDIIRGLAAAVCYLHSCQPPIVHGDITLSNVLIGDHGEPKLCDFGLTRIRHEFTRTGSKSGGEGTLRYMAPEILSGQILRGNIATDIYACSLTIFGLATLEKPFAHTENEHLVSNMVQKGERPAKPANIGTFSRDSEAAHCIWKLIVRMWDQVPTKRPPMATVKKELDGIGRDGSILAPTTSSIETIAEPPKHASIDHEHGVENTRSPSQSHPVLSSRSLSSEPPLFERERRAMADLSQYLEDRATTNFFTGLPLAALTILSISYNVRLRRSAALAFAEITAEQVCPVSRDGLYPVLFLLSSHDTEVLRAASAALGNLAANTENKSMIVRLGGLEPLIHHTLSPDVGVQCNAVACITTLATHDENKTKIAQSGALVSLTRAARSNDMRVQRNATSAFLSMTHSDENCQHLIAAGAIPVLVNLLESPDTDVRHCCVTALCNIAVDPPNRNRLATTEPTLIHSLVALMDSHSLEVQCQAALALRNLASDEKYQEDIVRADGLPPLLRLLNSTYSPSMLSAAACVRNVSIHPLNGSSIIEAGFLNPLIDLLSVRENEEIQCHAMSTLLNLVAGSEKTKGEVVQAGVVQKIKDLILTVPPNVQSEMAACVAALALSNGLKPLLLEMGICEALIPLTNSPSIEVQWYSAAAIGNLSSNGGETPSRSDDCGPFNDVSDEPDESLHKYLRELLEIQD